MSVQRFDFAWDPAYRLAALPFLVTPRTAYVEVAPEELRVRFGLWSLRTPLTNVRATSTSGGYTFVKTAGPPHLSLADRGISFATNARSGLCVQFHGPVRAIDPTGRIKHPGATLTVDDVDALAAALERRD